MTEIDHSGRYIVSYIPVEVGVYNISILWNGREVAGKCHFTSCLKLFAMNNKLLNQIIGSVLKYFDWSWFDQYRLP